MENTSNAVDPAADLAMLDRAMSSVDLDQALDFGPWWYAPMISTMVASVTLFSQPGAGDWSFVFAIVAIATGTAVSVHDYRRRKVRLRPGVASFKVLFPMVLGAFVLLAAWGTAVSSIGYDRFVPWYAMAGWALTTGLLLGLRAVLGVKRQTMAKI